MQQQKKIMLKIIVLGESGVGKTSLLVRYVQDKFTLNTKSTIGTSFLQKRVELEDGQVATCQIWDTAGQERFAGLGNQFFRGSDGVVFVYDITKRETFDALEQWRKTFLIQAGEEGNEEFPMLIIGNKTDLEDQRQVTQKDLNDWCKSHGGLLGLQTSVKDCINVDKAFQSIVQLIVSKMEPTLIKFDTGLDIAAQPAKPADQGCC
eukprot:TRINITY_DN15964_c0_g1_i1.p1 TRINITY_DN15964_c0_g1~~TRINITY_DN15964_c0_g1_i1.p1  ORF type:complete len:206 (+),score=62.64 TRINITY_DN15964_c0_g1_i1:122-739(+)